MVVNLRGDIYPQRAKKMRTVQVAPNFGAPRVVSLIDP